MNVMKVVLATVCVAMSLCAAAAAAEPYPERIERGGLPAFYQKLAAGKPATIVYFGGSITEARNGWRVMLADYFRKRYPQNHIRDINSGIGGTGSLLGILRLDRDVLKYQPDLVLVEFAVNDANANRLYTRHAMEGIVRRIRQELPDCEILFVYTATAKDYRDMSEGKAVTLYDDKELLAAHYGIPSVFLFLDNLRLFNAGKMELKVRRGDLQSRDGAEYGLSGTVPASSDGKLAYSPDGTHPYAESGHTLYFNVIKRALEQMEKNAGNLKPRGKKLPNAQDAYHYGNRKFYAPDAPGIVLTGEKTFLPADSQQAKVAKDLVPQMQKVAAGGSLKLRFRGSSVCVFMLRGPDCGMLSYQLDERKPWLDRAFTGQSSSYTLTVPTVMDQPDCGEHTLTIQVLTEPFNKRNLLWEKGKKDYDRNPERYKNTDLYIGGFFINGELLSDKSNGTAAEEKNK